MKKIVLLMFTMLFAGALTIANAQEVVYTTGSKKGSYFKYGHNMKTFTGGIVKTSKGSIQNFDRLMSGEANVMIGQKDAYALYLSKKPEAGHVIEPLGDLKKECLYAVTSTKTGITSDSDMQEKGVKVAIGRIGSGSQATWTYMKQLESGFKKATGMPKGGTRALAGLTSGKYDVVLSMQTPSVNNKLVKTVLNNKDLRFVHINDYDLNDKLPSGDAIYTHDEIDVSKGFFGDKEVDTICTTATVFIRTDLDEDVIDTLAEAVLNNKNYILNTK